VPVYKHGAIAARSNPDQITPFDGAVILYRDIDLDGKLLSFTILN
jgi:hypothetical protein